MNLNQFFNTFLRAAIYRVVWRMPPWMLWTIVGVGFVLAVIHR